MPTEDRRSLLAQLEAAGIEASRLEQQLRERGVPITEPDMDNCRLELLIEKLWGPFDPDRMRDASELRQLYELDYLKSISSRMRQALVMLPPPAEPQ